MKNKRAVLATCFALIGALALVATLIPSSGPTDRPSGPRQAGGVDTSRLPDDTRTFRPSSPSPEGHQAPKEERLADATFEALTASWRTSSPEELEARLAELAREADADRLVARANRDELSTSERARLGRLIREHAALNLLLAEHRLDQLERATEGL